MGKERPVWPSPELKAMADVVACKPVTPTNENTIRNVKFIPAASRAVVEQAAQIEFVPDFLDSSLVETADLSRPQRVRKLMVAVQELKRCELDRASVARAVLRLFLVGQQVTGRQYWNKHSLVGLANGIMCAVRTCGPEKCGVAIRAALEFACDEMKWLTPVDEKQEILSMHEGGMKAISGPPATPLMFPLTSSADRLFSYLQGKLSRPSYTVIAHDLQMSPNTIAKAYAELHQLKLLTIPSKEAPKARKESTKPCK